MNVTAVVLSSGAYARRWQGLEVIVHRSTISSMRDFLIARFAAAMKVKTPHFFFLDDDDDLPGDYLDVIQECVDSGTALAYTNELVANEFGETELSEAEPYSRESHIHRPRLVHHLALYRTDAARAAISRLPVGHFVPDYLLAFEVAAAGGASFIPRVGYVWHRGRGGMHSWPCTSIAQVRTQILCRDR